VAALAVVRSPHATMKENRDTTDSAIPKRQRRLIAAALIILIGGATAIIWPIVHEPPRRTLTDPASLPQYYVLSPTNGVLKQYLVTEGEMVAKSAPLAQVGNADHEQHVRNARAAVAQARLTLEEARLEARTLEQTAVAASGNMAALDRSQARRDKQAILDQEQHVRQLEIAVTTAQAKLVKLRSQPFGREGDTVAIDSAAADVTRLQSKLDVATTELKQRREQAAGRLGGTSAAAAAPAKTTETGRRVDAAAETMQRKQAELDAIIEAGMKLTSTVQAPFDGLIIRLLHPEGSFVREGQPVAVMMQEP
jgi:multidrug resistance efflux pump